MKLPTLSRVLVLIGALLLGGMYVLPLWRIDLGAPQYPEGIGLLIRVNTVEGQKPQDLRNINSLNHYIGMRPIEPDAIPELRYMPWILGGLIVFGVATALVARRGMLWAWLGTLVAAAAAGLYDFWRWGHDYGHNLDEATAIIKVPGMTYSPPVIGTKQLLNFTATSLPDSGTYLAAAGFLLGAAALWLAYRCRGPRAGAVMPGAQQSRIAAAMAMLLIAPVLASCATSPEPIRYGEDSCAHCRMVITDRRFGGSVLTSTGRTMQFDALECLVEFVRTLPETPRGVYVSDFFSPGTMLPAGEAAFLSGGSVHGPMGAGLVATRADRVAAEGDAELQRMTFAELLALPPRSAESPADHGEHGAHR